MKRTALAYAIATSFVSLVVIAGTSSSNSPIEEVVRVPVHVIDHDGMDSKRDDITVVIREIGDHDDSVGTRDKTGGIDTDFVAAPDPNDSPNTELPPIDCTHPSYTSLCNDLKEELGNKEPEGPPQNVWTLVYSGSNSNSASYKLAGTPKRIRINGSGSGEAWFGEHINRILRQSVGGSSEGCYGQVATAQCTWSFNRTSARGCYDSAKGVRGYKWGGANHGGCSREYPVATVNMKFSRIEVMY
ncbi:hypothetical protein PVK63_14590 [Aliivibrio sp. S2TY2]|uniref:hypothetical protein n=1 Tax=unclassified Aliivibrio TaxID=2645654 RepID=UPI002379C665|nr:MULTISPECIES: hypothetical protein [unclassified Aliivibrio]MDD9175911.1 hypothetical protein [Aliivibrio sp. S3TY1]MDD9193174.1 hypothetical protein [Aliivibrio sp. S2TY2]